MAFLRHTHASQKTAKRERKEKDRTQSELLKIGKTDKDLGGDSDSPSTDAISGSTL